MDTISGLPAHPLLVHVPVVLLPLAAIGTVFLLLRRAWYERYRWAVLGIGAIGTLGAILAANSGESLEGQIRAKEGFEAVRELHDHTQAGDLARTLAILFLVALAAYVVIPWILDRGRTASAVASEATTSPAPSANPSSAAYLTWLRPALSVVVAATAVASMASVVNAGHTGASRAWDEFSASSDEGG